MNAQRIANVPNQHTRVASFVACSSSKVDSRTVAYQLYDSTLFQKSFSAAQLIGEPYIMSAKHGLLRASERIDPYDEYLGDKTVAEKQSWGEDVVSDIPDTYDCIVLFGGRDYVEPIVDQYDGNASLYDAYKDTSGIGQQLSFAGDVVSEVHNDNE